MALSQDELEARQSYFRTMVVALCVTVLLVVVYLSLNWSPGGYLTDRNGVLLTDEAGRYMAKQKSSSDVVAIIGAVTTFLGTLLGTYFGINAGAQAAKTVGAAAQTAIQAANDTSAAANKTAAIAHETATIAHESNIAAQVIAKKAVDDKASAIAAQDDQTSKVRSILGDMEQAQKGGTDAGASVSLQNSIQSVRSIVGAQ